MFTSSTLATMHISDLDFLCTATTSAGACELFHCAIILGNNEGMLRGMLLQRVQTHPVFQTKYFKIVQVLRKS